MKFLMGLLLALYLHTAVAIDAAPAFEDPVLQARYEHLAGELRCLKCQNETIKDSGAQIAGDLRRELREQIQAGKSDEEILKFLTDRYGDFVRYRPPLSPRTILLWAAPILLLVGAIVSAVVVILRRSRLPISDTPEESEARSS